MSYDETPAGSPTVPLISRPPPKPKCRWSVSTELTLRNDMGEATLALDCSCPCDAPASHLTANAGVLPVGG